MNVRNNYLSYDVLKEKKYAHDETFCIILSILPAFRRQSVYSRKELNSENNQSVSVHFYSVPKYLSEQKISDIMLVTCCSFLTLHKYVVKKDSLGLFVGTFCATTSSDCFYRVKWETIIALSASLQPINVCTWNWNSISKNTIHLFAIL